MTEVRVGDVRETLIGKQVYVVSSYNGDGLFSVVCNNGDVLPSVEYVYIGQDTLLKHYDTFIEAIASKEFKGE